MTVKLAPESTKSLAATGKLTGGFGAAQKRWLPSDFRLRIDGLDDACTHVTRIEPFSVKQKVVDGSMGVLREPTKEPASLEVSNLVITVPEANVAELVRWHQSFVLQGQSGDDKEKEGTLDYMTPNSQEVLFSLKLHHLGIFKLVPDKSELGTETVRRVRAEMYVESVDFSYNTAAAAP